VFFHLYNLFLIFMCYEFVNLYYFNCDLSFLHLIMLVYMHIYTNIHEFVRLVGSYDSCYDPPIHDLVTLPQFCIGSRVVGVLILQADFVRVQIGQTQICVWNPHESRK